METRVSLPQQGLSSCILASLLSLCTEVLWLLGKPLSEISSAQHAWEPEFKPYHSKKGIFLTYPCPTVDCRIFLIPEVLIHNLNGGMVLGEVTTVKQTSLAGFPHLIYEHRLHNEVSIFRPREGPKAPGSLSLSCRRYLLCVSCNILYNKPVNLFPGPRTPISGLVIGM